MADPKDGDGKSRAKPEVPLHTRLLNQTIEVAETIAYGGIAIFLAVTAVALLVLTTRNMVPLFTEDSADVALEILDTLLLVFIVVELLYAVRITVAKRELLAEPFLLAGIIASIKEIIVLSVKAAETAGKGAEFRDQMVEIGVLGVLVLLLGLTAFLLRRKEREPGEGDQGSPYTRDEAEQPG
ncbi:MAG: phosphate-starvation-inducible PsiE family protein [Geodermatophilaceae bacterium]